MHMINSFRPAYISTYMQHLKQPVLESPDAPELAVNYGSGSWLETPPRKKKKDCVRKSEVTSTNERLSSVSKWSRQDSRA